MKRSECINILIETLGTYDSWREQCDYMLAELEKAGMLPPPDKVYTEIVDKDSGFVIQCIYDNKPDKKYQLRYWEPEDEC